MEFSEIFTVQLESPYVAFFHSHIYLRAFTYFCTSEKVNKIQFRKKRKCFFQIDAENFTLNLQILHHHIYLFHLFHMKYSNIYSKIVQINMNLFRHV